MPEKPNPFEELDELIERMNREFGELSRTFEGGGVLAEIAVDVADTGDDIVVTADLPGFDESDIDLRAERDAVTLSAASDRETVADSASISLGSGIRRLTDWWLRSLRW